MDGKFYRHCRQCGGKVRMGFVPLEERRRHVCQSCGLVHYQNPTVVAATLPVHKGKVYLLRRTLDPARGLWTYPAGYMEMGETVMQAAQRETHEEILTRVKVLGLHGIYSYPKANVVTVVYLAKVIGPKPRISREALEVKAFKPSEIPWKELAFRSTTEALREWANKNRN